MAYFILYFILWQPYPPAPASLWPAEPFCLQQQQAAAATFDGSNRRKIGEKILKRGRERERERRGFPE